jgi:hypothetical protein
VPGGGTRYLQAGGVNVSSASDIIIRAANVTAISIEVDTADAARSYTVEVITNPSGIPVSIATLTLPVSVRTANTTAVSGAVPAATEVGVRLVRATGVGAATFNDVVVLVGFDET